LIYINQSEKPIRAIWEKLARKNISPEILESGIRPHITLAVYDELQCQSCEKELTQLAARTSSVSLQATHVGVFYHPELVVFLAPTPTRELLDFQAEVHACLLRDAGNPWEMYLPEKWVPHCTLAINIQADQLPMTLSTCSELHLPFEIQVTQIGASEFLPIKDLFKFNLKSE